MDSLEFDGLKPRRPDGGNDDKFPEATLREASAVFRRPRARPVSGLGFPPLSLSADVGHRWLVYWTTHFILLRPQTRGLMVVVTGVSEPDCQSTLYRLSEIAMTTISIFEYVSG